MSFAEEVLRIFGVKSIAELPEDEREHYKLAVRQYEVQPQSLQDWHKYIQTLKDILEEKLFRERDNRERDMIVARLENCNFFLAFFKTPDKTREAAEKYLESLHRNVELKKKQGLDKM